MAKDEISLVEFQMTYPALNLKAQKDNPKIFDYGMLYCYTKECEHGFKVKKVNKTNRKGTSFTYVALKGEKDFKEYKKVVNEMINSFNTKYATKVEIG